MSYLAEIFDAKLRTWNVEDAQQARYMVSEAMELDDRNFRDLTALKRTSRQEPDAPSSSVLNVPFKTQKRLSR